MLISQDAFFKTEQKTVVALGTFDGVHAGHRAVIGKAVSLAQKAKAASCVWCLSSFKKAHPILSEESKQEAMKGLGVDIYVSAACSGDICALSPEEFFKKVLVDSLHAETVVCGFNFTFGRGGIGTPETLDVLCKQYGLNLAVVPAVLYENQPISSTRIRRMLSSGQEEKAKNMLL